MHVERLLSYVDSCLHSPHALYTRRGMAGMLHQLKWRLRHNPAYSTYCKTDWPQLMPQLMPDSCRSSYLTHAAAHAGLMLQLMPDSYHSSCLTHTTAHAWLIPQLMPDSCRTYAGLMPQLMHQLVRCLCGACVVGCKACISYHICMYTWHTKW